jgi:hypothetical protein
LCGREPASGALVETLDGVEYVFDKTICQVTFKKLYRVYGKDFLSSYH